MRAKSERGGLVYAMDAAYNGTSLNAVYGIPDGVDPCGENGEFHTFVHASPVFYEPLAVEVGEIVRREGFVFADVLPTYQGSTHPPPAPLHGSNQS